MAVRLGKEFPLCYFEATPLPFLREALERTIEARENMAVSFRATFPDFIGVKLAKHKHGKKRKLVKPKPKKKKK